MAIYNVLGSAIVDQDELYDNARELANLKDAVHEGAQDDGAAAVELSTGSATPKNLITSYNTAATGERVPFEPVGIGKPLTVEVRHVYTGRYPEANFWGRARRT